MTPIRPPAPRAMLGEALAFIEGPRLLWQAPALARQPRGDGGPVLVLPGFGAGDGSTALLRAYLTWLGYDARGWGLGTNRGHVPKLVPRVVELVDAAQAATRRRVRLVGWSLGGVLAREAARERPTRVERVVTFGTPVVGGPKYTAAAERYRQRGYDLDAIEAAAAARDAVPLRVPVTAIYSRTDGVVAWQACIDPVNRGVEHIEVAGTHVGLGFNPDVFRLVAERLALPARVASPQRHHGTTKHNESQPPRRKPVR
ncbi:MAG: alpha/beta hydrolase [Deltaproteobacteria bacterium]|nr:alpha/beta hydrolase [Deltaproteobacteria bacterium]